MHVSESTVRRVLAEEGLVLVGPPPRDPVPRTPWPDWLTWKPNSIWAYDFTHWTPAWRASIAILDVVSRKWLATLTSAEESSTQVEACFLVALDAEDLLRLADERATQTLREAIASGERDTVHSLADGGQVPLLLAISDNGPRMRAVTTREFMAGVAIAQQFGRPHTPQDQAWIETLFGHVKGEWPHLEKIRDPGELDLELDRVRHEYNTVRLHASIGYVTPDDEHEGRGEAIRQARRDGLDAAAVNSVWEKTIVPADHHHHGPGRPDCRRAGRRLRPALGIRDVAVGDRGPAGPLPRSGREPAGARHCFAAAARFLIVGTATVELDWTIERNRGPATRSGRLAVLKGGSAGLVTRTGRRRRWRTWPARSPSGPYRWE